MPPKAHKTESWDPNGAIVSAEGFAGRAPMLEGSPAKAMGLSTYAQMFMSGQDVSTGGTLGGPTNPYKQSLWIHTCISRIATNAARVPIRVSRGEASGTRGVWGHKHVRTGRRAARRLCRDCRERSIAKAREGEIVEFGDLYELLRKPNPGQLWNAFIEACVTFQYTRGQVHWLFDEMIGRRPLTIELIPGHKSTAVVDKSGHVPRLLGWQFKDPHNADYPVTLDECLSFRLFDPDKPFDGLSPLTPARLAIVGDYNASLFNAAMFANSCEPGGIIKFDAPFDQAKDEEMKTSWQQRHGGPMNARKLSVLWGGGDYKAIGQSLKDMVYPDGKRLNWTEICAVLGVPPSVAGFFGKTGDSSAYVGHELKRFWQDTEVPLLEKIGDAINDEICSRFTGGLEAWFDVEDVPVFQEMRRAQTETARAYWAMGKSFRVIDDWLDLGMEQEPQDTIGWLPAGVVPANLAMEGYILEPLAEGPSGDESDNLDQTPEGRLQAPTGADQQGSLEKFAARQIWEAWVRSWAPLAKRCAGVLRGHYAAQGRKVVKLLGLYLADLADLGPKAKASVSGQTKDETVIARILFEVFGDAGEARKFTIRLLPIVNDASELGLRQSLAEAGLSGQQLNQAVGPLLANRRILAAARSESLIISTKINAFTRNHLRRSLVEGIREGESVNSLADRVQTFMNNRRGAALTTARNTVGQTLSRARREGRVAGGMTHEIWIHSRGPGERREGHIAAEGRYRREPKPIGRPFIVNGVPLNYPRDTAGPPGEIVNCQCLAAGMRINKPAEGKAMEHQAAETLGRIATTGFVDYGQMMAQRAREQDDVTDTDTDGESD
ncbi:MAG TPA: phage portal protein [Phycisphaerae bacterium]|nr:phage portal protein [Phycisphaerae bacterium]